MKMTAVWEFWKALRFFLKHYPRRTSAVFAAAFALSGLELISTAMLLPLFAIGIDTQVDVPLISYVQDAFGSLGISYSFNYIFAVFIGIFSLKVILELVFGIFIDNSMVLIARNFRKKIINGLRDVSWSYLTHKPHGLIVNLMTQEVDRATGIFNMLKKVVISFAMILAYLALGVAVSFKLLLVAAIMGLAGIFIARPMFDMARRAGVGHIENLRDLSTDLLQGIQAYKVFKAMAREGELMSTLSSANDAFLDANLLKVRAQRFLIASQQLVLIIAAVLGVFIARDVFGVAFAELGFMGLVLMRLNSNLAGLLKKFQAVANMHYALDKFDEFQQEISGHAEVRKGAKAPSFPAPIRLEHVTFRYGERTILDDVSLDIPPSGLTAIIGVSGSGKTTIIDLICGFHRPEKGRVLIGTDDLDTIAIRQWRKMIGYVTQEPNLLHKSIAHNVAAFDDKIGDREIKDALQAAGAWKFVDKLTDGLQTNAGAGGSQLSGGERQRIAIARAMASKSKLLILDEPTAAVDQGTANELIETLARLKQKMPIIVVTHQPAMTEIADRVYQLEHGRITLIKDAGADPDEKHMTAGSTT